MNDDNDNFISQTFVRLNVVLCLHLLMYFNKFLGFIFAVDIWSVGCIFAELMSRKILFQSGSPVQQVSLKYYKLFTALFVYFFHVGQRR